ncbi:MAG: hypothetical protein Q8P81_03535 [Nanoarchaeota archaeon]|nr:hypothetical protein [Nanoarchaeota archaeon]
MKNKKIEIGSLVYRGDEIAGQLDIGILTDRDAYNGACKIYLIRDGYRVGIHGKPIQKPYFIYTDILTLEKFWYTR